MCIKLDYSLTKQKFICVYFDISEKVNSFVIKLNIFVLSSLKFPFAVGSLFIMKCHFEVS